MTDIRLRWSDVPYHQPIRIVITDWIGLQKVKYGAKEYLLIPAMLEYGQKPIELCVPYVKFIKCLLKRQIDEQILIREGKAVIQIMKTPHSDRYGMVIESVEEYMP